MTVCARKLFSNYEFSSAQSGPSKNIYTATSGKKIRLEKPTQKSVKINIPLLESSVELSDLFVFSFFCGTKPKLGFQNFFVPVRVPPPLKISDNDSLGEFASNIQRSFPALQNILCLYSAHKLCNFNCHCHSFLQATTSW